MCCEHCPFVYCMSRWLLGVQLMSHFVGNDGKRTDRSSKRHTLVCVHWRELRNALVVCQSAQNSPLELACHISVGAKYLADDLVALREGRWPVGRGQRQMWWVNWPTSIQGGQVTIEAGLGVCMKRVVPTSPHLDPHHEFRFTLMLSSTPG